MSLKILAVTIALSFPAPTYRDEPPETLDRYRERVQMIGEVTAEATQDVRWAWGPKALITATLEHMYEESRFDVRIHAGDPHPLWDSDDGKAACLGQLHQSGIVPPREWVVLAGTDREATLRCVRATMRVLVSLQRMCANRLPPTVPNMAAVFGGLSGRGCQSTPSSQRRAQQWARLMMQFKSQPGA